MPTRETIRACETATACALSNSMQGCLVETANLARLNASRGTAFESPEQVTCLAAAGNDCDAALRCGNLGAPVTSCGTPSTLSATCEGDLVRACTFGKTQAFDCASAGLRCVAGTDGNARCGAGPCGSDGSGCASAVTLSTCQSGVETRADCSIDGKGCVAAAAGTRCAGTGDVCTDLAPHCEGDVAVTCDGHVVRLDCAAFGFHCRRYADGFVNCAAGSDCEHGAADVCDGSGRVHSCYLGAALVVDCRADGFSGCGSAGCGH